VGVTLLSDVMPEPEEVVLSGVIADVDDEPGTLELTDDASELSVSELEALVKEEAARPRSGSRTRSTE
jgi:hypothetical protein